jgi:hypothetical protein
MTGRRIALFCLRAIVGIGSLFLSLYGLYVYSGLNLRFNSIPTSLYCFLPLLSFPAYLLGVWQLRASVFVQWVFALLFFAAYAWLNWRTCAELNYCKSLFATLLLTFTTCSAVAMFAVALLNLSALLIRRQPFAARKPAAAKSAR